ncbi:MAG: MFS transporter [Bacteroidetes bacterium]|nr:MAG: MFS transporter [Bacteroidota bacterium]
MKLKGLRWWIVTLVAIATVINYIDRNALGIMWPEIWPDIGLDEESAKNAYAGISTFFLIAYAISKGLFGRIFDIVGTRIGFVLSIVIWSLSAMAHAISHSTFSFSIFRALLGVGEAGNWPGATKANSEWFPVKERALAQGIFNSGASVGAIISAPLIAIVYSWVGWKMAFVLLGGLGFVWLIPWLIINRSEPAKHPFLSEEERQYILKGQVPDHPGDADESEERGLSWGELLRYRQSWSVLIARFALDPIWWLFVIWLPIYLHEKFGFNVKEIGAFAWVPYVGAALGSVFGGWWAGKLIAGGRSVDFARKLVIGVSGALMLPGLIIGAFVHTPTMAMIVIAVVLFGFQMAIGNIQTLPSDFFSGKSVGTLAGLGGTTAALGSILLSTFLIPWLSQISYVPVFILGAILVPLGVGAIFLLGKKIERVPLKK